MKALTVLGMHSTLTKLSAVKGLSVNTLKILAALNEKGPLNVFCIHAETGLPERTVSALRARAVYNELIQRTASSDRRQCVYELTPKLKELMN
ncbi:MAG: MarR family winged helix-turn-helix transcriptional regulator [Bermanella sp.]